MIHNGYLDRIRLIRQWADELLPVEKRTKLQGSETYAKFRRAVIERALSEANPDPKLLEIVHAAHIRDDGKVHIPMKKLNPRTAMTLSFLKMAFFGADRDVPIEILFNNYTQQLGVLVMLMRLELDSEMCPL